MLTITRDGVLFAHRRGRVSSYRGKQIHIYLVMQGGGAYYTMKNSFRLRAAASDYSAEKADPQKAGPSRLRVFVFPTFTLRP